MSSATSINRGAERAGRAKSQAEASDDVRPADGFKPAHFFVLLSLVGATVAVDQVRLTAGTEGVRPGTAIHVQRACSLGAAIER